jgi:hypothetical protein
MVSHFPQIPKNNSPIDAAQINSDECKIESHDHEVTYFFSQTLNKIAEHLAGADRSN